MSRRTATLRVISALIVGAALSAPPASFAQGIYTPVALKDKERKLIETSRELRGYFQQRSVLYGDEKVTGLVERVGEELAPPVVDDYVQYRFWVLRDPSPNAFALPNGDIYVHTGMLARLSDEAELAAVLAHEVNHVAGHHAIVDYRSSNKKIVTGLVLSGVLGGLGSLISAGLYTSLYGFSRELEQEADDRAVSILRDSRYDPHALPEIYDILAQDYDGVQPRIPTVWSTHPQLEARAARTRAQVADAPQRPRDPAQFEAVVLPVRTMTIRDYIQDDYPRTAVALATDLTVRYPRRAEFFALLGDAWAAMGPRAQIDATELTNAQKRRNATQRVTRTRQERSQDLLATDEGRTALETNLSRARDAYRRAIAVDPDSPPAYRGLGEVSAALGEPRDAARAYLDYLQRAPDADDRPVVLQRLRALRDQLRNEESGNEQPQDH
jgi:beta-barrel assembly-enhancing protease